MLVEVLFSLKHPKKLKLTWQGVRVTEFPFLTGSRTRGLMQKEAIWSTKAVKSSFNVGACAGWGVLRCRLTSCGRAVAKLMWYHFTDRSMKINLKTKIPEKIHEANPYPNASSSAVLILFILLFLFLKSTYTESHSCYVVRISSELKGICCLPRVR